MATAVKSPFVRALKKGVPKGTDIQAVKRALSRTGHLKWAKFDNAYNVKMSDGIKSFQKSAKIPATGTYGEKTHDKLVATKATKDHPNEKAFDEYANELLWAELDKRQEDTALQAARELLAHCRKFTGTYIYGGGHGTLLAKILLSDGLDCSSSSSKGTYDEDLFRGPYATNSTGFEDYGESGRGKYVTIHANVEHVWIEFTLPEGYYRFDTSPHGDGPRGPRVRTKRRFDSTFVHRHPKGL